jgi:hypothetical protein
MARPSPPGAGREAGRGASRAAGYFGGIIKHERRRKEQERNSACGPRSVRPAAGHKNDEDLEFRVSGGVITILPKLPTADDEYTPGQRRKIDARLAKADADIKAGRVSNAFSDHGEFIASLHKEAGKFSTRKTKRPVK